MLKQKIIKNNIFSLYINNTNTPYCELNINGGKIIFGDIDKTKHEKIKWYDVYKKDKIYYFWSLFLNEIKIDENKNTIINDKILIDCGTSDIILDEYSTDNIHKQIKGIYDKVSKRYIINNFNDLKNITFNLNGDDYILNPIDYTYELNGTIYSRIMFNNNSSKVLGLPFLQKYNSVYNFENRSIGLSKII